MKIKLTRSTVVDGKRVIVKSKPVVVDAPDKDARYLIASGKAEPSLKAETEKKCP